MNDIFVPYIKALREEMDLLLEHNEYWTLYRHNMKFLTHINILQKKINGIKERYNVSDQIFGQLYSDTWTCYNVRTTFRDYYEYAGKLTRENKRNIISRE